MSAAMSTGGTALRRGELYSYRLEEETGAETLPEKKTGG